MEPAEPRVIGWPLASNKVPPVTDKIRTAVGTSPPSASRVLTLRLSVVRVSSWTVTLVTVALPPAEGGLRLSTEMVVVDEPVADPERPVDSSSANTVMVPSTPAVVPMKVSVPRAWLTDAASPLMV